MCVDANPIIFATLFPDKITNIADISVAIQRCFPSDNKKTDVTNDKSKEAIDAKNVPKSSSSDRFHRRRIPKGNVGNVEVLPQRRVGVQTHQIENDDRVKRRRDADADEYRKRFYRESFQSRVPNRVLFFSFVFSKVFRFYPHGGYRVQVQRRTQQKGRYESVRRHRVEHHGNPR